MFENELKKVRKSLRKQLSKTIKLTKKQESDILLLWDLYIKLYIENDKDKTLREDNFNDRIIEIIKNFLTTLTINL